MIIALLLLLSFFAAFLIRFAVTAMPSDSAATASFDAQLSSLQAD